jgi:hypothetical protein
MAPGATIDYGALAQQAGAISSAPPTSSAPASSNTGIDYAALAKQSGAIATAPAPTQPSPASLTANPNHEGVYQMKGANGAAAIPYSNVRSALDNRYTFANDQEHGRFVSDYRADPARIGGGARPLSMANDSGNTTDAQYLRNAAGGAKQAATETFRTIEHGIRNIPVVGEELGKHAGLDEQIARDDKTIAQPADEGAGVGRLAENVGEFAVGDAELKYLGEGLTSLVKGANYAEKLKAVTPILKAAAAHPALAQALGTAIRSGLVTAGQAGAHGATGEEALEAGAEGAGFGGAADLALGGVSRRMSGFAAKTAPAVEDIAGQDVQTLASQRPGTGARGDVTTAEVPKVARAQQAAAPKVFQSVAQRATHDALEEANAGRVNPTITEPSRLLPAPEGSQPYKFVIPGTGTEATTAGEISQPAAKADQAAFKPPTYTTSSAPKPAMPGVEGSTGADIATSTPRVAAHDILTGGGDLHVTDPETAQMHLSRLNDLVDNPPPSVKGPQLKAITAARDSLQDQLDMYHAHERTLPNFLPIDSAKAAAGVGTFGEAEDQLQNAAKPIYQKLDEATNGEFNKLNLKRAAAGKRGALDQKFEIEDQIDKLVESAPGITPAERAQATQLWSKSKILGSLNDAIESASNVNEAYAKQVAGGRVVSGSKLQNNLNKLVTKYGRPRIESVIGEDGMQNMTRMADLLKTQPKGAMQQMTLNIYHNLLHGKVGAAAGGVAGHFAGTALGHGLGGYEGAAAGALMGAKAERYVLQLAATNPRVGQLLDFAARNAVNPRIYAPLISAEILRSQRNEPKPPVTDPGSAGYQEQ